MDTITSVTVSNFPDLVQMFQVITGLLGVIVGLLVVLCFTRGIK